MNERSEEWTDARQPSARGKAPVPRRLFCLLVLAGTVMSMGVGCKSFLSTSDASASQLPDEDVDWQLGLAQRSERSGDLVAARTAYREILDKDPKNAAALHRLGVVSVRLDQMSEAIDYLEQAAELAPPSSELLGDLGYAQFLHGDLESARATLDRGLAVDPTDKRLINNQGLVLGFLGKEEESLSMFRRAGNESEAMSNMGFVLAQLGEVPKARQYYLRALDLEPDMKIAAQALVDLHEVERRRSGNASAPTTSAR